MIRRKLPQVLVLSIVVFLLAAAQPAAAISSFRSPGSDGGLWVEAREMFVGALRALGVGAPERMDREIESKDSDSKESP